MNDAQGMDNAREFKDPRDKSTFFSQEGDIELNT